MISIQKQDCVGCNACGDVCFKQAISFVADKEGFEYPVIDKQRCVDCGLCEKVCPALHKQVRDTKKDPLVFAAYAKDESIRIDSTSGGLFSLFAKWVYKQGGYVGGAIYNEDYSVSQIVSNQDRLDELRSSKYLQSNTENVYKQIKALLKNNEHVLFCGTPCQVVALHNFLGKDYENLVTLDFLCRGVNSPKVFQKYIRELEQEFNSKVTKIKFKAKKWGWHNFSMRINFANGIEYCQDRTHDLFFIGYLQGGCFARPSCYNCKFKSIPHISDITIGDFWGIEKLDKSMDQDKGTSVVIVNTDKGECSFNAIKTQIEYKQFSVDSLLGVNTNIFKNMSPTIDRKHFFEDLERMTFKATIQKYFIKENDSMMTKVFRVLKRFVPYSIKRCFHISFWTIDNKLFHDLYDYDLKFNAGFGNKASLTKSQEEQDNIRILKFYRKCQAARGTVWFDYYYKKLIKIGEKTGVGLYDNLNIGKGLIIGHVGRIVINANACFSGNLFLTHGVTIGRDIRGKRKGVPTFGKNVVIRCNSTVVGKITIGDDVLIAPNTFVNFDIPSHSVVIGNPATIHHRENATEGHIGRIVEG